MTMIPLEKSWAVDQQEDDLRNLTIQLYADTLKEKSDEINVYGAPHIGPFSLIEREVARDGLTVLRTTSSEAIRHLFMAWRFRNPRRGTPFLRTYLQVLFGPVFEIRQLYQKKSEPYPEALASLDEITSSGEAVGDYFLTSRLRVDIETDLVPSRVQQAARTTVAARFVLDLRAARRVATVVSMPHIFRGVAVARTTGSSVTLPKTYIAPVGVGPAPVFGVAELAYFDRQLPSLPAEEVTFRTVSGGGFRTTTDGLFRITQGE